MSQNSSLRRVVNRSLGKNPKLGPFPANQIIPILVIMVLSYAVKGMCSFTWVQTAAFAGWLMGTSWYIIGDRPWRFFSRFAGAPRFVRGGVTYHTLLPLPRENPRHSAREHHKTLLKKPRATAKKAAGRRVAK